MIMTTQVGTKIWVNGNTSITVSDSLGRSLALALAVTQPQSVTGNMPIEMLTSQVKKRGRYSTPKIDCLTSASKSFNNPYQRHLLADKTNHSLFAKLECLRFVFPDFDLQFRLLLGGLVKQPAGIRQFVLVERLDVGYFACDCLLLCLYLSDETAVIGLQLAHPIDVGGESVVQAGQLGLLLHAGDHDRRRRAVSAGARERTRSLGCLLTGALPTSRRHLGLVVTPTCLLAIPFNPTSTSYRQTVAQIYGRPLTPRSVLWDHVTPGHFRRRQVRTY